MEKKVFSLIVFVALPLLVIAQTGVAVNKTGAAPDASAILDVSGTDGGILVPRMNAAQRAAISNPAQGLLVYDTDSTRFYYWDGEWITIANPHQLGGTANYAEFEDDGTLVFYGLSTTYEDLQVPALNTTRSSNPPELANFIGNTQTLIFGGGINS